MKKYISTFLFLGMLVLSPKTSSALLQKAIEEAYNTLPISPVINFGEDIAETGKMFSNTWSQVKSLTSQIKTDTTNLLSSVQGSFSVIGVNINTEPVGGRENSLMCGVTAGHINVNRMSKKLRNTLLSYDDFGNVEEVQRNRDSFYLDNVYNIYAALQVMKNELADDGTIGSHVITTKQCCIEGQGQICNIPPSTDGGYNEMLHTYAYALATLEDLVKVWERVAALKAQYRALDSILSIDVMPRTKSNDKDEDVSDGKNTSLLRERNTFQLVSEYHLKHQEVLANAQIAYKGSNYGIDQVEKAVVNSKTPASSKGIGLNFSLPKAANNESPIIENSSKLAAVNELGEVEKAVSDAIELHNFIKKVDDYRSTAQQYKDMLSTYQRKLALLRESNQCGREYVSRYFNSADTTWAGKFLSAQQVNDYDIRKGISGWAIDAYEVAKGAKTTVNEDEDGEVTYSNNSAVQTDSLETKTLTDEEMAGAEDSLGLDKADADVRKNQDDNDKGRGISESASKKSQDENRKASLLAWQIGAEASKSLSSDANSWGQPNGRKMIWNDTKIFYRQYLKRKYENIKSYLKHYTKSDVIDVFISKLQDELLDIGNTDYQTQLRDNYAAVDAALNEITSQTSAGGADGADAQALNKQKELTQKIDALSKTIKDLSDQIGDITTNAEEQAFADMDAEASKSVDFSESNKEEVKPLKKSAALTSDLDNAGKDNAEAGNIKALQAELEQAKQERNVLQDQLDQLKETIRTAKVERQNNASSGSSALNLAIAQQVRSFVTLGQNAYREYESAVNNKLLAALAIIAANDPVLAVGIKEAIDVAAGEVVDSINASVDAIVDSAYQQLLALGDDLYLPGSTARVKDIHEDMINKLKAITFSKSVMGYSIADMLAFADLESMDLSPENQGFFVGALPRARDLKAPYPLSDLSQPPVREVFHFDATDFANVKPYSHTHYKIYHDRLRKDLHEKRKSLFSLLPGGFLAEVFEEMLNDALDKREKAEKAAAKFRGISKEDFLECGSEIPTIWKLMLQENAFIETQFKLSEALNQGCETAAFLRGGIMPCRVGTSDIVLDVNVTKEYNDNTKKDEYSYDNEENQYIKRTDIPLQSVPKCILIEMKKNKPHHVFYDADVDILSNISSLLNGKSEPVDRDCLYSELGMLLDADENNNLSFKEVVYEVFNDTSMIDKKYENSSDEMEKEEKNQLAIAMQAELSRNQIGDFLRQVESEKKLRQSLEELKQKFEEQIKELKDILASYGYSLGDNYDITRDADYKLTVDRVKLAKSNAISKTMNLLSSVDITPDNAPALAREEGINKLLRIMQKDKEAELMLSMMSIEDNNLEESFKRAQADNAATKKYQDKVNENDEKYTDLEEAYCANY